MIEKMEIGNSGVYAPAFVLGTFGMGGGTSWQDTTKDDSELIGLLREAYDQGVWGLDTAPVYGTGRSERIVGQAIKGRREHYFISTKCSMHWRNAEGTLAYTRDGHSVYNYFAKASLIQDVEDSLKRMETDYIDLMIIHRCPPPEMFGEVMETMEILKARGLIRAVGLSNTAQKEDPRAMVETCLKYGQLDLLQEGASLLKQEPLKLYVELCEKYGITLQAYSSLEKGALAGKLVEGVTGWTGDNRSKYKWFQPENIPKLNRMTEGLLHIAEKYHCSVPALCLAWMRAQSDRINLLVGARKIGHLRDSLSALRIKLKEDDILEMNRLSEEANR